MQTAADFTLMAENCAIAALAATDRDEQLELLLMSAVWRNEALRMQLGERAPMLRQRLNDNDPVEL